MCVCVCVCVCVCGSVLGNGIERLQEFGWERRRREEGKGEGLRLLAAD